LSKSQVSVMARDLDELVRDFRERPLNEGPYTFVAADALTMKVREGGRVIKIAVMVATGVNADGYREILGVASSTAESGAGWNSFFKDLVARGLNGVALVTSDAHAGLVEAIGANLPGASWQRCRTHYTANLMAVCPKHAWGGVKAMLHSVFDQIDADAVHAQCQVAKITRRQRSRTILAAWAMNSSAIRSETPGTEATVVGSASARATTSGILSRTSSAARFWPIPLISSSGTSTRVRGPMAGPRRSPTGRSRTR
jgi:transposase-like protein